MSTPEQNARALLKLFPILSSRQLTKAVNALRRKDCIEGPRACAWVFEVMSRRIPPGPDRIMFRDQADVFAEEWDAMKRLKRGWRQFGEDDYWWVVHDQPRQWLPRYHSEPTLERCALT